MLVVMRQRRRLLTIGAVLAGLCATALVAAPAAQAADGRGWSFQWAYYTENAFFFTGTLPGVLLTGAASDDNGQRQADHVYLYDTDPYDGRCARAVIFVYVPDTVVDQTACDGGMVDFAIPGFHSMMNIQLSRRTADGQADKSYRQEIPDGSEPSMRTVNTGFSWQYGDDSSFTFDLKRWGLHVSGDGWFTSANERTARYTVFQEFYGLPRLCITGRVRDPVNPRDDGPIICNAGDRSATLTQELHWPYLQLIVFAKLVEYQLPSHYIDGEIPLPN
jgi:hypothetical protein